jgi:hypothetical protein
LADVDGDGWADVFVGTQSWLLLYSNTADKSSDSVTYEVVYQIDLEQLLGDVAFSPAVFPQSQGSSVQLVS